jgi:hypothetical protein
MLAFPSDRQNFLTAKRACFGLASGSTLDGKIGVNDLRRWVLAGG